jgi:hypothetical protein
MKVISGQDGKPPLLKIEVKKVSTRYLVLDDKNTENQLGSYDMKKNVL